MNKKRVIAKRTEKESKKAVSKEIKKRTVKKTTNAQSNKPVELTNDTNQKIIEQKVAEVRKEMEKQHLKDLAWYLKGLEKKFGPGVRDVVDIMIAERNKQEWREIAKKHSSHSPEDVVKAIWQPSLRDIGYEFSSEKQNDGVVVRITKCPSAAMAAEAGETKWGFNLICKGDHAMVEGFNPNLGLAFLQSMMKGDECCVQYFYERKDKNRQTE